MRDFLRFTLAWSLCPVKSKASNSEEASFQCHEITGITPATPYQIASSFSSLTKSVEIDTAFFHQKQERSAGKIEKIELVV